MTCERANRADSEQEQRVWMYVGHASCAFTAVFVLLVCALSERIQLTIELIKVTAKIIQETPGYESDDAFDESGWSELAVLANRKESSLYSERC